MTDHLPANQPQRDIESRALSAGPRAGAIGSLLGVLALDWAALDDILTGTDPSLLVEMLVLAASVPAIAALVAFIKRK